MDNLVGRSYQRQIDIITKDLKFHSDVIKDNFLEKVDTHNTDSVVDKLLKSEYTIVDLTVPGYNYLGPGTSTLENYIKKKYPVDKLDQLAFLHDIDYAIANSKSEIKLADQEFLDRLDKEADAHGYYGKMAKNAIKNKDFFIDHKVGDFANESIVVYKNILDDYSKIDPSVHLTQLQQKKMFGQSYKDAMKQIGNFN